MDNDKVKETIEQKYRHECLNKALSLYGASKYSAGEVTVGKPEEIVSAAKTFYNYICGGTE